MTTSVRAPRPSAQKCAPSPSLLLLAAMAVGACTPKAPPGPTVEVPWQPVDCEGAEAGLEFFQYPIVDFEYSTTVPITIDGATQMAASNVGRFMYGYVDGSSTAFAYSDLTTQGQRVSYQPPAVTANPARCTSGANNHVFHITGGPFLGWGGGLGVAMSHFAAQDLSLCSVNPRPDFCPPPSAGNTMADTALDLSAWDGVALWARRETASQPLLRVLVANKYTDDDFAFVQNQRYPTEQRYCERVRECACTYQNLSCTLADGGPLVVDGGGYYCGAPGSAPGPTVMAPTSSDNTTATNTCNVTRCNEAYSAYPNEAPLGSNPDRQFNGRPCTAFRYRNGLESSFCFDPASDPTPAQPDEQCGDHFTFPLHLTTEWQLYLVPFNTMYQQGFAKRFPFFDTSSITAVRMTWDAGPIDYWIDDLRFYRVKR